MNVRGNHHIAVVALTLSVAGCCCLATVPTQLGQTPEVGVYVGIHAGGHFVASEFDLHETPDFGAEPSHSAIAGLKLGVQARRWLGVEVGASAVPYLSDGDLNLAIKGDLDLVFGFAPENSWVPYAIVGGGTYANVMGSNGIDQDLQVHYGFGVRGVVHDNVAIRVEAQHILTDGLAQLLSGQMVAVTLGLDIFVWRQTEDRDEDGVPDRSDACPDRYGSPDHFGCPDRDGDRISDEADACPDIFGTLLQAGCPDADLDGVSDHLDNCPNEKGPPEMAGCADRDGDGVGDTADKCPDLAGNPKAGGCPDRDGDTIPDTEDKCPDDSAPSSPDGCSDLDGDGLVGAADKCPNRPGPKAREGCPEPVPDSIISKFNGALRGINFEVGSERLTDDSRPVLNSAATALKSHRQLRVQIEGHTDNRGSAARNQELSGARAESVRAYLVAQGVAPRRLVARGIGEASPVASNRTKRGRAKNRRIEFRIINQ